VIGCGDWWLTFLSLSPLFFLKNQKQTWINSINRDHNRETVLQHIRSAHYHPSGVGTNHSSPSLSVSSTGLTSGGQMAIGEPGSLATLLPPPQPAAAGFLLSSGGVGGGGGGSSTSTAPAFRCGVCNQVSNWKHVIQVFLSLFLF
jgi:hypothetical protein